RIGLASLVRFADITHTTLTDMRGTTSPRLMLELLSARMLLPDAASDSAALLQRLERLERRQGMAVQARAEEPAARTKKPVAEQPPPAAEQAPAAEPPPATEPPPTTEQAPAAEQVPATEQAPAAEQVPATEPPATVVEAIVATVAQPVVVAEAATDSNALRQLWPEVMAALRDRSKVKWAMMNEVVIASVEGEVVNLLAPAGLARRIAEESNLSVLREVLQSVVFGHWQLTISAAASANGAAGPDEPMTEPDPAPDPAPRAARPEPSGRPERSAPSERSGRAESPTRAARPEPADQPPAPVADDDGVDEESDEVHGSPRAGGDAEAAAIELLQTSLGARPIDAS
ncbi:MAG TPA: hypothetical protein VGX49_09960, partial [Jatrophihabitans sp.]|nr:hypothetical protein [Jatrophihabitans sp.]